MSRGSRNVDFQYSRRWWRSRSRRGAGREEKVKSREENVKIVKEDELEGTGTGRWEMIGREGKAVGTTGRKNK